MTNEQIKQAFQELFEKKDEICKTIGRCSAGDGCPAFSICPRTIEDMERVVDKVMNWQPPVDWMQIKKDTPILVSNDGKIWSKRYFAAYADNGKICTYPNGITSWTGDWVLAKDLEWWEHAKLAEEEQT